MITTIRNLYVKDFITCIVDGNLNVLAVGDDPQPTMDELKACFESLLSQYYRVKKDEGINYYIGLMRDIKQLELRMNHVQSLIAVLDGRYSVAACDGLRHYYPRFEFSDTSYATDARRAKTGEKSRKMKLDELNKDLADYERENGTDKPTTPDDAVAGFYARIMDISKAEGVKYSIDNMTVLEFALAEYRLRKYCESLEKQIKKR